MGRLRLGNKSAIVPCFKEQLTGVVKPSEDVQSDVILDGTAVVQLLKPGAAKTFKDYVVEVFIPYLES